MKKLSLNVCATFFVASIAMLSSCTDQEYYGSGNGNNGKEEASLLRFLTSQDVQFNLRYEVAEGYVAGFSVYAENPLVETPEGEFVVRPNLKSVAAGICESGNFNITKKIPAYITELYAYSENLFAPKLMHAEIINGVATFQEVNLLASANLNRMSPRTLDNKKVDYYLYPSNSSHRPATVDKTIDIPAVFLTAINKSFPEAKPATAPYIGDASIEIVQDAELWVTPLTTTCSMRNALGYFCYDGSKEELAQLDVSTLNEKEIIALPWTKIQTGENNEFATDGLHVGDAFQLKYYDKQSNQLVNTFPAGTTIVWILHTRAYDMNTQKVNEGVKELYRFYSVPGFNFEDVEKKDHTIFFTFEHANKDYLCVGFEDQRLTVADKDYNDLIFHVEANPSTAIVPPPSIIIDEDDYVTRTETRKGVLAFEDNWPSKGDYDMNDAVVKYESNATYRCKSVATGTTFVTKLEDTFTFVHAGATFNNGFSYKVNIDPSFIENSEVLIDGVSTPIQPDGDGFIVDVCENINDVIVPYEYDGTPKSYKIEINILFNKVRQSGFDAIAAPYNPFIAPREREGVEVHLSMYAPTTRAALSYFGTDNDKSDFANSIYYVAGTSIRYPFAIHLSGISTFKVPTEKETIDFTYPRYNNWVESDFEEDKDWYVLD